MALINAIVTTVAREQAPKMYGSIIPFQPIAYFRIGEGGWIDPGTGRVRRDPSATLTNLDLAMDPGRSNPNKRYSIGQNLGYFQKTLTGADFTFEGPSTLRIRCFLDYGEYNTKNAPGTTLVYNFGGTYTAPEIWEIGVFDAANNLIAYGTVPQQTKDGTKQIENVVRLVF